MVIFDDDLTDFQHPFLWRALHIRAWLARFLRAAGEVERLIANSSRSLIVDTW